MGQAPGALVAEKVNLQAETADELVAVEILSDSRWTVHVPAQRLVHRELHPQLPTVLAHGAVIGTADAESRLATATRNDYAAAAATVLAGEGHENMTYELSGDRAWSLREYTAEVSRPAGKDITYQQVSAAEYRRMLSGGGLPEAMLLVFVETEDAIARGRHRRPEPPDRPAEYGPLGGDQSRAGHWSMTRQPTNEPFLRT